MGQVLKIDHDEAALLARQWTESTGEEVGLPSVCDHSRLYHDTGLPA